MSVLPRYFGADCPRGPHRIPEGPNEDVAMCGLCGSGSHSRRPSGETFGWHLADCSLPLEHEGACMGGGTGHGPIPAQGIR